MAFMDGFDLVFAILRDIEMVIVSKLPMFMYTDSEQLLDTLKSGKHSGERCIMVDVMVTR